MLAAFALGVALTVAVYAVYLRSRVAQLDLHRKRLSDTMDKVVNVVAGGADVQTLQLEPPRPKETSWPDVQQIRIALESALPSERLEMLRPFIENGALSLAALNALVPELLPSDRAHAIRAWHASQQLTAALEHSRKVKA